MYPGISLHFWPLLYNFWTLGAQQPVAPTMTRGGRENFYEKKTEYRYSRSG